MTAPAGPFTFPTTRFRAGSISPPEWPVARNRLRSGAGKGRIIGAGFLRGRWETPVIGATDRAKWKAFFANLRAGNQTFLGWDSQQPFPVNYPDGFDGLTRYGGGAFDGTCGLVTITSVRELVIAILPPAFVIKAGTWMGVTETISSVDRWFLAMIAQDATADASGVATVYIESALPAIFTTSASINFDHPVAEFVLDAGSVSIGDGVSQNQPVSFSGTSRVF